MPQLKINYIGNKLAVSKLFCGEVLEAVVILAVTFDDDYAHGISLPPAFLCHVTKSLLFLPYKARNLKISLTVAHLLFT